uniref:J domain-containing protein n=1 Tax=Oryza punctata TaxID=4537 RepID=A0A0E0JLI3_ORYPU
MEELAAAAAPPRHRERRRHRRKASSTTDAAAAAYGDVFGGPPQFAAAFDGVPADYGEVFGGVAASCSIPYLDLPPAAVRDDGAGAGAYGEIFGRFDFGDFAEPYEDLLAEAVALAAEIASSSESSRSSVRKESGQLDAEPSILHQHYPTVGYDQHFDEDEFSPISSPPDSGKQFSMSYNKATRGRPDDIVKMTTCMVEPSISYVVDSRNMSNKSAMDHVVVVESDTFANGEKGSMGLTFPSSSSLKSASSDSVADQNLHTPICHPISKNDCEDEDYHKRLSAHSASSEEVPSPDYPFLRVSNNSLHTQPIKVQPPSMPPSKLLNKKESKANGEKGSTGLTFPSSSSVKSASSDPVADQNLHTPTCHPISKNDCEDEDYHKRLSTHSASSEDVPSPDYPFLRVPNNSLHTQPIKVQPPSMPPSKLFNKKESKSNGDSEVSTNSAAAAAAIKEAMEFAEARLKAAKELMERKGDSFKLRKKPGHHRGTKSTELKESMAPEEVCVYDEKLIMRRIVKEQKTYEETALVNKNGDISAVNLTHCDHNEKRVLLPRKPQHTVQSGSKLEQLGKWTSGAEFYELISPDQKCKTNSVTCEGDNIQTTNPSSELGQFEKGKGETISGDFVECGKSWDGGDIAELRMEHVNLREYAIGSTGDGCKAPTAPEISFGNEKPTCQESTETHFKECVGAQNYQEGYGDDGRFEISCVNSSKLHAPEIPGASLESCKSGGHCNGNKNPSDASAEETTPLGKSNKENNNIKALEVPCADEMQSQILQEYHEVRNESIDDNKASQVIVSKLEESVEYYETPNFQKSSSTAHVETEIVEKEKMFSFSDELCPQNENIEITKAPPESLIHEENKKFGTEEKAYITLEGDVVQKSGSLEREANITLESASANENEEAEVANAFVEGINVMETHVSTCGTSVEDSDQIQDSENRMDGMGDLVSHGNEEAAKDPWLDNSEKSQVEENFSHEEGQPSVEGGINEGPNDAYAGVNAINDGNGNDSETKVIIDDGSDCNMKMSTCSKELNASFLESSASMQHLSQIDESISAQTSDESTPLENLGEDCREREFPEENSTALEQGQAIGSKMEGDGKDKQSKSNLKDQKYFHLDSYIVPKFKENTTLNFVQKLRDETPDGQRIEGRENVKKTLRETEKEVLHRLDEDKERYKMEREKEQAKERSKRELEEEKERERERAKDRLAVQRATKEAHERAFAEARAKAERIALERITLARQRASAEAREKEEKATEEAATEKASREARLKAERAAVERATAEARERAIEKAKAAADAKERMERFRSSFKDSFKSTNQDNQLDKQVQKTASNNYERSTDSSNQVVEFESALRHKARSEREQRTAERAAKALAEKNMRDMLAQREQAERHRLAEYLDPEVKRWSNGKEGNLRALLSTLQYILGSDSGWQSVPLTDLITATAVKKAYRRATLCVHPDKLQQRGATIRQKYICEKVFDLLKEAWNKFNSEER